MIYLQQQLFYKKWFECYKKITCSYLKFVEINAYLPDPLSSPNPLRDPLEKDLNVNKSEGILYIVKQYLLQYKIAITLSPFTTEPDTLDQETVVLYVVPRIDPSDVLNVVK